MMSDGSGPAPEETRPRRRFAAGVSADDLREYMAPYVARLGYRFNDDEAFVAELLESELGILDESGDIYCPCRLRSGDPGQDAAIVCPCIAANVVQFAHLRKCWCGLFVRTDVENGASLHGVIEDMTGPVDVRVAAVDDMRDGQVRHVKLGKRDIALVRAGGDFYALSNVCRHAFAPLADGFVDGLELVCPMHGWRYDVRDGSTDHPDSDIRTYPVTVRGGEVFVTVSD
jgi:nitrite reductase/ring-hydroxylating ferredoxin subunit/ferredoxin-thioredoxin reductase catalytic subunit